MLDSRINVGDYNITEGTSTLTIDFVSNEDSDDYFCTVPGQTYSSPSITLVVPNPPLIQTKGHYFNRTFYNATEGENVVFFCKASGQLNMIRWLDDDGIYLSEYNDDIFDPFFHESLEYYSMEDEESDGKTDVTVSTLVFHAESNMDGWNFTCQAW